jgi:hypothetical protein
MDVRKETYTCSLCKGKFEKTWRAEEALEEIKEFFTEAPTMCDDCFYKGPTNVDLH